MVINKLIIIKITNIEIIEYCKLNFNKKLQFFDKEIINAIFEVLKAILLF